MRQQIIFLGVAPRFNEVILKNLASSEAARACNSGSGWMRVVVEKPFGEDLKSARRLEKLLDKLFKEDQIYRIDHYLAKEMTQNILSFRFSNNIFEPSWNKKFIEKIKIRVLESVGVEDRGSFYDGVGALRDFGPNHILQMLALITMDHPKKFDAGSIRSNRTKIFQKLIKPDKDYIEQNTFRAQYDGYRKITGVKSDSKVETYFKIKTFINNPAFKGVPIILESGKRLGKARKDISITFKHPVPCLCPISMGEHYKNKVIISLEPVEGITVQFGSKKTGFNFEIEERSLGFSLYGDAEALSRARFAEGYEKLLLDCILGDQTLFVSTEEVVAMWRFIDPILQGWRDNLVGLHYYNPDTPDIIEESKKLIEDKEYKIPIKLNDPTLFPI